MGLIDNIQNEIQQRMEARIVLKEPITIEELYGLMETRWSVGTYGGYKLQKMIGLKWIDFDDYYMMHYRVQISSPTAQERNDKNLKNNIVFMSMKQTQKNFRSLKKEQREQISAATGTEGLPDRNVLRQFEFEHLKLLANAMRKVLEGRVDSE